MAKNIIHSLLGGHDTWWDRISFYSLIVIGAITPLAFTFRLKSVFTLPKLYILTLMLVVCIVSLFIGYMNGRSSYSKLEFKDKRLAYLVGFYGLTLIVSTMFSVSFYTSLFGDYGRFLGVFTLLSLLLLFYIVTQLIQTRKHITTLLSAMYVSISIAVLLGILQHHGLWLTAVEITAVGNRAFSTFGHANHFGGMIVQFMWASGALYLLLENVNIRRAILAMNLLSLIALFETSSRGAFIALIVTALCFVVLFSKIKSNISRKVIAYMLITFLVCISLTYVLRDQIKKIQVVDRTISTIEFMRQGNVPDRVSWSLSALEMAQDKPLFGYGVSTFSDVYNRYRRVDYKAPGDIQDTIVPESAHNEYLHIAATQGLISLIAYLALIGYVFKLVLTFIKETSSQNEKLIAIFLAMSSLTYLLQVGVSFGTIGTMTPFFMLLGVTYVYVSPASYFSMKRSKMMMFFIVTLTFTLSSMWFVHRLTTADRLLRLTEGIPTTEGYALHVEAMHEAVTAFPYSLELTEKLASFFTDHAIFVGRSADSQNLLEQAIITYKSALKLNDNQALTYLKIAQVYMFFAEINEQVGNEVKMQEAYEFAEKAYDQSLARVQNNPLYLWRAAEFHMKKANALKNGNDATRAFELYKQIKAMRENYPLIDERLADFEG